MNTYEQLQEVYKQNRETPVTWQDGDKVLADGKEGIVGYIYTNGYTLVLFPDKEIKGGIFDNDCTYGNRWIKKVEEVKS